MGRRVRDLAGKEVYALRGVAFVGTRRVNSPIGPRAAVWRFECLACGREVERFGFRVLAGSHRTCGCVHYTTYANRRRVAELAQTVTGYGRVKQIARQLRLSRWAVTQHLRALRAAAVTPAAGRRCPPTTGPATTGGTPRASTVRS